MKNEKAIELLKEMTKEENWAIGDTGAMYYMPENIIKKPWEVVNQALALLRQQPPAGEFTAKLINVWNEYLSTSLAILNIPRKRELAGKVNDLIGEICSCLNAAEQRAEDLQAELASARKELKKYGTHLPDCKFITWKDNLPVGQDVKNCTCGFEQARKEGTDVE